MYDRLNERGTTRDLTGTCSFFGQRKLGWGWGGGGGAEGINILTFLSLSLPPRRSLSPSRNLLAHVLGGSPKSLWVGGYLSLLEREFIPFEFKNSSKTFWRGKADWRAVLPVPRVSYPLSSHRHPPHRHCCFPQSVHNVAVIEILWILVGNWTIKG